MYFGFTFLSFKNLKRFIRKFASLTCIAKIMHFVSIKLFKNRGICLIKLFSVLLFGMSIGYQWGIVIEQFYAFDTVTDSQPIRPDQIQYPSYSFCVTNKNKKEEWKNVKQIWKYGACDVG